MWRRFYKPYKEYDDEQDNEAKVTVEDKGKKQRLFCEKFLPIPVNAAEVESFPAQVMIMHMLQHCCIVMPCLLGRQRSSFSPSMLPRILLIPHVRQEAWPIKPHGRDLMFWNTPYSPSSYTFHILCIGLIVECVSCLCSIEGAKMSYDGQVIVILLSFRVGPPITSIEVSRLHYLLLYIPHYVNTQANKCALVSIDATDLKVPYASDELF